MKIRAALIAGLVLCLVILGGIAVTVLHQSGGEGNQTPPGAAQNGPATSNPAPPSQIGQFIPTPDRPPAPELSFADQSGGNTTLAELHGRLVLVNLWATWCAPCIREMPSLDRLRTAFPEQDLAILLVAEDHQGAEIVTPFLAKQALAHLTTALDPKNKIGQSFAVRGLPTTILIGRNGEELGRVEGAADWDSPQMREMIRTFSSKK